MKMTLVWAWGLAGCLGLAGVARVASAASPPGEPEAGSPVVTNVVEAARLAQQAHAVLCSVRLEGVVLWTNATQREFVFQDESGAIPVELEPWEPAVPPVGRLVHLAGLLVAAEGKLRSALVNNDGLHPAAGRSETVYLAAGRYPLLLDWFNGPAHFDLQVEYEGPGVPRQRIPDSVLFHAAPGAAPGTSNLVHGLDFRCYEGVWKALPGFEQLRPVKTGTVANFDLDVKSRSQQVGLRFSGLMEIPRTGLYTFWVRSDDGARFYLGRSSPQLRLREATTLPTPQRLIPGQRLTAAQEWEWACVEGVVTSAYLDAAQGLELQLSLGTNRLYLEIQDAPGAIPPLFSRVRATGVCRSRQAFGGERVASRLLVRGLEQVEVLASPEPPPRREPASLAELRRLAAIGPRVMSPGTVTGCVWAVSPSSKWVVVADASATTLVETDARSLQPGQVVTLSGTWLVEPDRLHLQNQPVIDNDGRHNRTEKTGTLFLPTGKHPLHVSWFNHQLPLCLEVSYACPGHAPQCLTGAVLFRPDVAGETGAVRWAPGLDFRCYEGAWAVLPNPSQLAPTREGWAVEVGVSVGTAMEEVGLEFWGFLDVPRDGVYTFSLASDDGSHLFVGEVPRVRVTGNQPVPTPRHLSTRQALGLGQPDQWAEVEGTVAFAREHAGSLEFELNSSSGPMHVEVVESAGSPPWLLLNSRLRVVGVAQTVYSSDGQTLVSKLLVPSMRQVEVLDTAPTCWTEHPLLPIGWLARTNLAGTQASLVHICGQVVGGRPGKSLVVQDDTGQAVVETTQGGGVRVGAHVEALGWPGRAGTNLVLRTGFIREVGGAEESTNAVPRLLTTVEQVKRLSREEAKRGYPVRIRGVITEASSYGFFIQDATWGIAVRWRTPAGEFPARIGDYWEVEGVTTMDFAPLIEAQQARRLGPGVLPEPLRPSWDQLINGSLDTLYVEVQGIVANVDRSTIVLLTRQGKLKLWLGGISVSSLKRHENALIRVRGCVVPERNRTTQQVEVGQMRLANASVSVEEAAPAEPFAAAFKHARDLFLFDPGAGGVQRVRIAGQVLHGRGGEFFILDGTNGMRVMPKHRFWTQAGDWVEAVGFVELGGPSPSLREATMRRSGPGRLPPPVLLPQTPPVSRQYDATLVRVQARVSGLSLVPPDQVLELQAGGRGFIARLETWRGVLRDIVPGSWVEVTGVYAGKGGNRALDGDIDSFELLLNAPADVRVLSRPSWWTAQHTLAVLGGMAVVILGAVIWITLLRRQVEDRSRRLAVEIQRHAHTERQRALEEERARIARDLHDDLGATLTQIRFLSALESRDASVPEGSRSQMGQISEKSRQMVASLDEIVWALNPTNDSLSSLATYLCQVAEELFRAPSGAVWTWLMGCRGWL